MARVALRKFESDTLLQSGSFSEALDKIFPDATAYLARCIRSVISDTERVVRRDVPTVSMDQPLAGGDGGATLTLGDTFATEATADRPEEALLDRDARRQFRAALAKGLQAIPKNYLSALQRDMAREHEREAGMKVAPESANERQTICRARAALSEILRRECGLDNPFVRLLAQQRSSRVRQKSTPSPNWTKERQNDLFRRLMNSPWAERAAHSANPDDHLEEAVVNEVSTSVNTAPPSPEMRQAMRVMDIYTLDSDPKSEIVEAQIAYDQALSVAASG